MKQKKSLLKKMLLFIGVPVAIIFCVTAAVVLTTVRQSVTQLTNDQLTAESQAASYQIANYFSKYNEAVKQMVANDLFQEFFLKSAEEKAAKQNYEDIKQTADNIFQTDPDNYASVWIADCATNTMISTDEPVPYSLKLSERPWYNPVVEKKDITIIEPYQDMTTGNLVMSMIAPIYKTGTSDLLGFGGVDITIDRLGSMVQSYKLGKTGFYILTTDAGQVIYHPDSSLKTKNITESGMSKNIISAIQSKTAGAITYTAMKQTNHGYLSPISNTGWTIATGLPEKEFSSKYNAVQLSVYAVFTIALLILIILLVIMSKSIINPLKKLTLAANRIAEGDLDVDVSIKSSDETGQVANAFSRTVDRLKQYIEYIDEVSSVLDQIAVGNLVFELHCDYIGEFSKIKSSLENIKSTLVTTFDGIAVSAEQVASGSNQVANASQSLAQGATEQASSIQELSASITEIAGQVNQNAENAENASQLADVVFDEMQRGNEQMQKLIEAMSEMSESSNEIGKIIKTIQDIAFQTNILALNAAVEAARAGAAGKGFAVVADEVRNLASKSAEAAENTTVLIANTINSMKKGTKMADETAQSLNAVNESAQKTTKLIEEISQASKEQSYSINQVTTGIDQISSVVQTNSATSEESAASSEELNGQAQTLKSLVAHFKTNSAGNAGEQPNSTPISDDASAVFEKYE